ncbi:MAG TPA: hypothetical protein VF467_10905 [Afipia sp.]
MSALSELNTASASGVRGESSETETAIGLAAGENLAPASAPDEPSLNTATPSTSHADLAFPPARHARSGLKRTVRALVKPLIALATAQYILVTALAGVTAFAIASGASSLMNASLDPIIAALKRF